MTVKPAFLPIGDRVLVLRDDTPDMSPGGLHLPKGSREKPSEGVVIAVGSEEGKVFPELGTRVFFGKYSGNEIEIDSTLYVVLKTGEILGRRPSGWTPNRRSPSEETSPLSEGEAARQAFLEGPADTIFPQDNLPSSPQ